MMSLGTVSEWSCFENEVTSAKPLQPQSFQNIFHQSSGNPCASDSKTSINASYELEGKLDEQEIRIDILELELDQHKEAMSEKISQLNERDSTIKTQCFHIVSLHHNVCQLTEEISKLNNVICDLRNQLWRFTNEDWQNHAGVGKKRKLDPWSLSSPLAFSGCSSTESAMAR